jgi:hypothetical protein
MKPVPLSEYEAAELQDLLGLYPEAVPEMAALVAEIRATPWAERERRVALQAAKLKSETEEH